MLAIAEIASSLSTLAEFLPPVLVGGGLVLGFQRIVGTSIQKAREKKGLFELPSQKSAASKKGSKATKVGHITLKPNQGFLPNREAVPVANSPLHQNPSASQRNILTKNLEKQKRAWDTAVERQKNVRRTVEKTAVKKSTKPAHLQAMEDALAKPLPKREELAFDYCSPQSVFRENGGKNLAEYANIFSNREDIRKALQAVAEKFGSAGVGAIFEDFLRARKNVQDVNSDQFHYTLASLIQPFFKGKPQEQKEAAKTFVRGMVDSFKFRKLKSLEHELQDVAWYKTLFNADYRAKQEEAAVLREQTKNTTFLHDLRLAKAAFQVPAKPVVKDQALTEGPLSERAKQDLQPERHLKLVPSNPVSVFDKSLLIEKPILQGVSCEINLGTTSWEGVSKVKDRFLDIAQQYGMEGIRAVVEELPAELKRIDIGGSRAVSFVQKVLGSVFESGDDPRNSLDRDRAVNKIVVQYFPEVFSKTQVQAIQKINVDFDKQLQKAAEWRQQQEGKRKKKLEQFPQEQFPQRKPNYNLKAVPVHAA